MWCMIIIFISVKLKQNYTIMAKESQKRKKTPTLNERAEECLKFDQYGPFIEFCKERGVGEEDPISKRNFFKFLRQFQSDSPKY